MSRIKTLSVSRAINVRGFGADENGAGSLENLLKIIHPDGCTIQERSIDLDGVVIQARHFRNADDHHLLHLVAFTRGEHIQVAPSQIDDLRLEPPPADADYLDEEMMVLVRGNDVLICRCGLSDGAFTSYVERTALRFEIQPELSRFALGKQIDMNQMEMIVREGVHQLKFNAVSSSVAAQEAERRTVKKKLVGSVLDELKDILGMEGEVPEDAENIKVEVALSFDKRAGGAIEREQILNLAQSVLHEEDQGFAIKTMSGKTIRAGDVLLSTKVRMPKFGKSVRHTDAWNHLAAYDHELRRERDG